MPSAVDPVLLDDWHVVADRQWLRTELAFQTMLLGVPLAVRSDARGEPKIVREDDGAELPATSRYGFVWASLGSPRREIIHIPEAGESDRHVLTGGSIAVHTSGLRVVENFLDMGHFPFVHTNYLGAEPHTEVEPYSVEFDAEGILATDCRFFQPIASPTAAVTGIVAEYVYRVFRPYTVALYKTNPSQTERKDFIALFVQPVDEEHAVAHPLLCYLKDGIDEAKVRWFMQLIFAQDKPILENHVPKRLPLDPRTEISVRADASSIAYRRWLREQNVTYGTHEALGPRPAPRAAAPQ